MTIFGEMIKRSYKEDTLKKEDFCQIYFENGEPLKIDGVYKDIPYSISSNGEYPDIDIAFPYTVSTFTGLKKIELYNRNKKKIEFYRHIAFRIIYCTHSYSDLGDYIHNKRPGHKYTIEELEADCKSAIDDYLESDRAFICDSD